MRTSTLAIAPSPAPTTPRITVCHADGGGWYVNLTVDGRLVASDYYTDWHRVERRRAVLEAQCAASNRPAAVLKAMMVILALLPASAFAQTTEGTAPGLLPEPRLLRNAIAFVGEMKTDNGSTSEGFYVETGQMITGAGWISGGPGYRRRFFGDALLLVVSGMDCMRVNCAHDNPRTWSAVIEHLRRAAEEAGRPCRVLMDLAGPKLRTGPVEPGPAVLRWKPERDVYGRVVKPARIWLTAQEASVAFREPGVVTLLLSHAWISNLRLGAHVELFDARGARRDMTIVGRDNGGVWAESPQTAYVMPGTPLLRSSRPAAGERRTTVLELPRTEQSIPSVFDNIKTGEAVWFDDGRIGAVIRSVGPERMELSVTRAAPQGSKLGADKGINLPDTTLPFPALTPKDLEDLRFIVAHADIVGHSFVRTDSDVRELQSQLSALGRPDMPVILKIETRRAFENLPDLLLALMRPHAAGVMIARKDLAVECRYERLAEVQEEMLWMAEASHMPVIWATQVLERLAKDGIPSRAEITDAAMGERAECVMLNKGPHILEAVRALDNILRRMQAPQRKKTAMLRNLGVADRFLGT